MKSTLNRILTATDACALERSALFRKKPDTRWVQTYGVHRIEKQKLQLLDWKMSRSIESKNKWHC